MVELSRENIHSMVDSLYALMTHKHVILDQNIDQSPLRFPLKVL